MIEAAQRWHALLNKLGFLLFCRTSGGNGRHVVVPITRHSGWDELKDFAKNIAQHLATTLPSHFTVKMGPHNGRHKIFNDYRRNSCGASTSAADSTRARPGIGVSVPIEWDEVPQTTSGAQSTITTPPARLDQGAYDPREAYRDICQRITARMRA